MEKRGRIFFVVPALLSSNFYLLSLSHAAVVAVSTPAPVLVSAGESCEIKLKAVIQGGFHIQANPASHSWLIESKLEFQPDANIVAGDAVYPPGRPLYIEGADIELSVYDGEIEIGVPIAAKESLKAGSHIFLKGTLSYQPCDEKACLFPEKIQISVPVQTAKVNLESHPAGRPKDQPRCRPASKKTKLKPRPVRPAKIKK